MSGNARFSAILCGSNPEHDSAASGQAAIVKVADEAGGPPPPSQPPMGVDHAQTANRYTTMEHDCCARHRSPVAKSKQSHRTLTHGTGDRRSVPLGQGGCSGPAVPQAATEYGGAGCQFKHNAVVIEEACDAGVARPHRRHLGAQRLVLQGVSDHASGNEAQKRRWLSGH